MKILVVNTGSTSVKPALMEAGGEGSREPDHPLADRRISTPHLSEPPWPDPGAPGTARALRGVAVCFCAFAEANPGWRLRVGGPDETRSKRPERMRIHEPR